MKKLILLLAILIPTLALFYFALQRNPRELPSSLIGKKVTPFQLTSLDGKEISLEMAKGKPVVINFWSTWCGPCIAEYSLLKEAAQDPALKEVVFYSVLYEDTPENAKSFMKRYGTSFPVLLDPDLRVAIDFGVAGVPETFFIDAEGALQYKHAGALTPRILDDKIRKLKEGRTP